jgi:acyl-coenzyme A synthetase/AMP-(fatty) acid ligase
MEHLDKNYNIAFDCLSKHTKKPDTSTKPALIYYYFCKTHQEIHQKVFSYHDLEIQTNRFANVLEELHINPGDRIIIHLDNKPEFLISFIGAIKIGAIPIPVSSMLTSKEIDFLCDDSKASLLISDENHIDESFFSEPLGQLENLILLNASKWNIFDGVFSWDNLMELAAPIFDTISSSPDSPAFWMYTSGTQGKPKAVVHAHRSIPAHDERVKKWQNFKAQDKVFNTSSLNWSYQLTNTLDILRHGGTSIIYNGPINPKNISEVTYRSKARIFMSVPGIYRKLLKNFSKYQSSFNQVEVYLSAGEKLNSTIRDQYKNQYQIDIYEGLGMTEHSVYLIQEYGKPINPESIGKPINSDQIKILDENFKPCSPHQIGILATRSDAPGLMLGYQIKDKGLIKPFQKNWFLSGDLAYSDPDNNFYFMGRKDDIITSQGYKISPLEVENYLNSHPLIEESALVEKELDQKNLIIAFITIKENQKTTEEEILEFCQKGLAKYKCPHKIIFLDFLPKTKNGKIKRKILKENYLV